MHLLMLVAIHRGIILCLWTVEDKKLLCCPVSRQTKLQRDSAAKEGAGETKWNAEVGNEASGIDFYVKACLIIDVPDYLESRGIPVQLPKKKKRKTKQKKIDQLCVGMVELIGV